MSKYAQLDLCISHEPWVNLLWKDKAHTMEMKYKAYVFHMLLFMYDKALLNKKECEGLVKNYALACEIDEEQAVQKLQSIASN